MYSLLQRGIIPRDVDLTPAFERGSAPFTHQQSIIDEKSPEQPKQLSKVPTIKYLKGKWQPGQKPGPNKMLERGKLPDPEVIPTANLQRDHTFLTAMNVENNDIFNETG